MKCFFRFYNGEKKKKEKEQHTEGKGISVPSFTGYYGRQSVSELESAYGSSDTSTSTGHSQSPNLLTKPNNLKIFTLSELKQATKNFSNTAKLGEGGFGCVFKGTIRSTEDPTKEIHVAVKQLDRRRLQGHKEWATEINVLGTVEHPNLVKLIGHCAEDDERGIQRLLIYEYMRNGSVDTHLSKKSITTLPWATRLRIALDTAHGLAYLHEGMDFQIIVRDFKSSNILLDEKWNAKLSDFGLARLGPSKGRSHVSTVVSGTMGYAAPEYIRTGHLRATNDVWSYGVFLFELITGKSPFDQHRPKSEQRLLGWVKPYLSDCQKFQHILDPKLEGKPILKSAYKLSLVANRCLAKNPKLRPKMSEVRQMVNEVLDASTNPCDLQSSLRLTAEFEGRGKRRMSDSKTHDKSFHKSSKSHRHAESG